MKCTWVAVLAVFSVLVIGGLALGHMGGPGMSRGMMATGPMGWMGSGMMGPGWCPMMGSGYQSYYDTYHLEPLAKEEAAAIADQYVFYIRNPNLKVGDIRELEYDFEVDILTKEGSLAGKILIDKQTEQIRPIY